MAWLDVYEHRLNLQRQVLVCLLETKGLDNNENNFTDWWQIISKVIFSKQLNIRNNLQWDDRLH